MDTRAPEAPQAAAERQVTALYQAHALSLARLALLMLGDADAAQDVVQDAFRPDGSSPPTRSPRETSRGPLG